MSARLSPKTSGARSRTRSDLLLLRSAQHPSPLAELLLSILQKRRPIFLKLTYSLLYDSRVSMNARKRRAPEPLLPVRSTKVPRTARSHPQGGHATVSQTESEGLIERWTMFGEMFMKLGVDTIHYVCCLFGMTVSVQHDLVLMRHAAGTPTSQQDEREHDRPVRTRQPEPSASAKRTPIEPPPPPRAPTRPSDDPSRSRRMLPPPPPRPSSSSQTGRELRIQKTGLPSPPTTNVSLDSSTSSGSLTGYHPEIDAALQKVQSRERRSSQTSREREHIYARKVCTSCSCSASTVADCMERL